jgi:aminopeptidase N
VRLASLVATRNVREARLAVASIALLAIALSTALQPAGAQAPPPSGSSAPSGSFAPSDSSLITWGPLPPGSSHAERPRTYDLKHQIVHVRFDWTRRAVVGSTTLKIAPLPGHTPPHDVALDAVGMRIVSVTSATGAALQHTYDGRTLIVHVRVPTTFTVSYESVHPKKGVYFIDRRHIVWTQGDMEDTRYWVPTYDELNDKATWEFFIRTARGEKALSNGRLVDSHDVDNETEWHWALDKPASTYLMTVVTGDYVVVQDKWRTVPLGYWTYPDSVQAAWRGFGETPHAVELYSGKTGVDYPWAKYDQVVAPDFIFGGMENVTATTQNDDAILHPAWAEPEANAAGLMAHELGHQWYGDDLTMEWWNDSWLSEGFATFMEQYYTESTHGVDEGTVERIAGNNQVVEFDRQARRPLVYDRWVNDPLELFTVIYPKGAAVLQMLRHQLGDSLFWAAMHRYTVDHAFASVTTADLEHAFEQTGGRDFTTFFHQWVYGAGMPAIRVSATYDSVAHQVTFTARQVQPRDSLTDFFDAPVDVAVFTDHGVTRGVVNVHGEVSTGTLAVDGVPRAYRWDVGRWLLEVYDFPRPTPMLIYQLQHDDDVAGRLEAVKLLHGEPAVVAVAKADPDWGVREAAAAGLTDATSLIVVMHDRDPRVRSAAAKALGAGHIGGPDASAALRIVVAGDSSLIVRGQALVALAQLDTAAAMPLIRTALATDSWTDIERVWALRALALTHSSETYDLALHLARPGATRFARLAAFEPLVAAARETGRRDSLATELSGFLDDPDLFVREAVARSLGALGLPGSVTALESRKRVEADGTVLTAIDDALTAIRSGKQ